MTVSEAVLLTERAVFAKQTLFLFWHISWTWKDAISVYVYVYWKHAEIDVKIKRTLLTRWCGSQGSDGSQTACGPVHSHVPGRRSPRSGAECAWRAWWSSSAASGSSYPCWGPPEWSCSSCGRRSFPPGHLSWPLPALSQSQLVQTRPRSMGCPSARPESLTEACCWCVSTPNGIRLKENRPTYKVQDPLIWRSRVFGSHSV